MIKYIIVDFGMGNLHSVKNAFEFLGKQVEISSDPETVAKAQAIILPGVGAFPDAAEALKSKGLFELLRDKALNQKVPFLGICLGMQLLLTKSYEFRECEGLSLIDGTCEKIQAGDLKIPHIGWNSLSFENKNSPLLCGLKEGDYVYFVHSFAAKLKDKTNLTAATFYGQQIPGIIEKDNIFGCQFHPEKSEKVGLKILDNFCDYCAGKIK